MLFSVSLGMFALGTFKTGFIRSEYITFRSARQNANSGDVLSGIKPIYHLSKNQKNVVVLFIDRAVSSWIPCMIKEFPDLADRFDGFTYYPNTVSHGSCTNTGIPSMVAGYEYTPDKINARDKELLVDKHNEACLVMPKIFSDAGYDVTVTDMPWLGYLTEGDLSVWDQIPAVHGYNVLGRNMGDYQIEKNTSGSSQISNQDDICRDKIKFFSLLQAIIPIARDRFYTVASYDLKFIPGITFMQSFSHLYFLPKLTDFTNNMPTYTFIGNNTAHDTSFLQVPDYDTVISEAEADFKDYKFGYETDSMSLIQIYQSNTAAILQTAKWLDYLKENNVYDNTRIIVVADHGHDLPLYDLFPKFKNSDINIDFPTRNNPLLMVKDFNNHGTLKTDWTFMSNADTIFLALQGTDIPQVNPFSGKTLSSTKSQGITVYEDWQWNAAVQKHRTTFEFDPNIGYIVRDNLFDPVNWTKISDSK